GLFAQFVSVQCTTCHPRPSFSKHVRKGCCGANAKLATPGTDRTRYADARTESAKGCRATLEFYRNGLRVANVFRGKHLQRRPLGVEPLGLDQADLVLAHAVALGDPAARLRHAHLLILSVYEGVKDFLA